MATFSSILAWGIPWTEEPDRPPVHRVTEWDVAHTMLVDKNLTQEKGKKKESNAGKEQGNYGKS